MARMLWKNRIGEEQTVSGVTFKFVDYVDGKIVMVDSLNHNTHVVSKDVWKRGVFKDIMKKLQPTTSHISEMVEERIVKDVLFKVVGVVKGKVEIIASGCDYFLILFSFHLYHKILPYTILHFLYYIIDIFFTKENKLI